MIYCFKDELVKLDGSLVFIRDLHDLKGISETLNTNTNRSVFLVGVFSLFDGIVVSVNDLVEISGDSLGHLMKEFVVVLLGFIVNVSIQSDGSQIANCNFIGAGVFNNLSAEVGALNSSEVLLI